MKCEDVFLYLADYLRGNLRWFTRFQVARHLKKCFACRESLECIEYSLNTLESDILPEPPPQIWQQLKDNIVQIAMSVPRYSAPKLSWFYRPMVVTGAVIVILLFFLLLPRNNSGKDGNSILWTFFHSDLWDFSTFFKKVDNEKLAVLTPKIEQRFKLRLKKELELDVHDESRLFPILQSFSQKMKEYCYSYGYALAALSVAVEKDKKNELDQWLQTIHTIREKWTHSRWELLKDVRFILNKKQFARFLIFTERIPQEIQLICSEVGETNS